MAKRKKQEAEFRPHVELAPAMVDNPLWSRAYDGDKTNPRKITAMRNVKESPAAFLYSKGALDDAQLEAADMFRKLFEAMGGTGARAIDWRREFVDGGRTPEPISVRSIHAGMALRAAHKVLVAEHGVFGWKLVGYVCGEGKHIHEMFEVRRQRETMTDLLRMYLDCLSQHWNLATKKRAS
jgi:hypothetical protein